MDMKLGMLLFFLLFLLIFRNVFASGCSIITKNVFWDDTCNVGPEAWYDFGLSDSGGNVCAIGASTIDYNQPDYWLKDGSCWSPVIDNVVWKYMTERAWPTEGLEGQVCKARGNWDCDYQWEGNWDKDDQGCVQCNTNHQKIHRHTCENGIVDYTGPNALCESACGADPDCDERSPGETWHTGNVIKTCDSNCKYSWKSCGFYTNNGNNCKTSCTSDNDCADGYRCYKSISKCWKCNGNDICESVTNSKPGLQEIANARSKYPNSMIGVDSDFVYHFMKRGVIWKDSYGKEREYSNAYELYRDKGANWVRVVLHWNETQGLYNLDYINKTLHLAKDAGFNIIVDLTFEDPDGPQCINLNRITVPSKYCVRGDEPTCPEDFNPNQPCIKFDTKSTDDKIEIMREYAGKVSEFFENEGIHVKIYELGYQGGIDGFTNTPTQYLPSCSEEEIKWYNENVWSQEADVIKVIIPELKISNPYVLIQSHVDLGWECREFVYEYYKTMLGKQVGLNIATMSYYPSIITKSKLFQEVHQNPGYLLSEIDWVHQKLWNDFHKDIKFIISEFDYPSSPDLNDWFFLKNHFDNQIQPFHWSDYSGDIFNWLKYDYCPKCQETNGYGFSPEEHARWLRNFYDTINSDPNIIGTFILSPENADIMYNNFCSLFGPIPETYDGCPDCCNSDGTATNDNICHIECGAHLECDGKQLYELFCVENIKKGCNEECNSIPLEDCSSYGQYCTCLNEECGIIGDINGDKKIDMKDISFVAKHFGSHPEDDNWDSIADIDYSGKVDMKDIAIVAKKFGATCSQ